MSDTEKSLQLIKAAYAAFFAGDIDGFFEYYGEDIVLIEAETLPYGGTYQGRDTVMKTVRHVISMWDGMDLDIKVITADGDWVIAYGQFSAVGKATGIRVSYPLAEVWRVADGKIRFLNPVYGDTALACKALGAPSPW